MLKDRIHTAHPVYNVRNLPASVAFYRDGLGLEVAWEVPEAGLAGIRLNAGAIIVLCVCPERVIGAASAVFVMNIDSVDDAYAELGKRGVIFDSKPEDREYGRAVDLHDPDGHRLCLVSE